MILAPAELSASAPIPFGRDAGASAITISVGEAEGLLMIRAPIRGSSFLGETERALRQARCEVKEDEQPAAADAAAPELAPTCSSPSAFSVFVVLERPQADNARRVLVALDPHARKYHDLGVMVAAVA